MVNEVLKGTPAEKAEIEVGDIILKINERDIENMGDLRNTIAKNGQ
jgi:S1-C subfamily serine protease